jgi:hypothetical protein
MTPDPRHDVIVYQVSMVDALTGESIGDRWTVWVGTDSEGSFATESEALALAIELADGRPAWLVKEGGAATPL